jgi:hypothetical protein
VIDSQPDVPNPLNPLKQLLQSSIAQGRGLSSIQLSISMSEAYQIVYTWFKRNRHLCDYLDRPVYAAYARKLIDLMPEQPTTADMRYLFSEVSSYGLEWAFPIIAGRWPVGVIVRSALEGAGYSRHMPHDELAESSLWQAMRISPEWQAAHGNREHR